MKKAIVCGAGIGGLVSAIRLANKNFEVEIFEKNDYAGGKMGEFRKEGFRFDTGPSVITMPEILREFFSDTGRDIDDYIELIKPDTSCTYYWTDGTVFNCYNDDIKLHKEIADVFTVSEANGFLKFMDYSANFFDIYTEVFGSKDFSIRNYFSKKYLYNITKFISGRSINDVSNKFFRNVKLKQIINRYAAFTGSSPYLCPQFFSIIPYVEFKNSTWYVKGGIYKIASALEKICREYGIKINYNCELKSVSKNNDKITGLNFLSGNNDSFDVNVFDVVVSDFTNLKELTGSQYFENTDWSSSGFVVLMAMDTEFRGFGQHNVLFSDDYENEYIDIFEKKIPADDMTIYISITGKSNPDDCPAGNENWFVFVNAPFLSPEFQWTDKSKLAYFNKVLDRMESYNFLFDDSIRNHIKFYDIICPEDFKMKYNSEFGSIYGLSSNSIYTLIKRPKNKSPEYNNLFFTGGNTNPGGGVPTCFISGKIVADLIQ